jgi:uncharacterized protein
LKRTAKSATTASLFNKNSGSAYHSSKYLKKSEKNIRNDTENNWPIDPRERDPQFKVDAPKPAISRGAMDDFDLASQLDKPLIVVQGYGPNSFRVNGEDVFGSVLLFRDAFFSWNVTQFEQITPQSLVPIQLHHPAPELLILGVGPMLKPLSPAFMEHFKKLGVAVEVMNTPSALATFNFLNQEERSVAAALLVMESNEDN